MILCVTSTFSRGTSKAFAAYAGIFSFRISEAIKGDRFHRVVVRGDRVMKNSHGALYVIRGRRITVMQRQVEFCGKEEVLFRPED